MPVILHSKEQIKSQIEKARLLKPRVRFISLRNYEVQSESVRHLWHKVRFTYRNGLRLADCDCQAGERSKACFHLCAALPHHLQMMVEQRDAQRAA